MQGIEAEPGIIQSLVLEICSRWPHTPPATAELARLGIILLNESRVIAVEGQNPTESLIGGEPLAALFDPLIESIAADGATGQWVDVYCRPGVTDAEGDMASLALAQAGLAGVCCRAGLRYRFADPVPPEFRERVERLVGNPLIHRFLWDDAERVDRPTEAVAPGHLRAAGVATIEVEGLDDDGLTSLSRNRGLALDLAEMRAIQTHFFGLERAPTDVELESIALTWSEHCSHKTFKATIDFDYLGRVETIQGLLNTCIAEPTAVLNKRWVHSAFVDNAGMIALDARYDLAFKVETHNHPSALEPYGGAHTGVGGVIRDILAVSAEPIANTDVLCFGPLDLPDSLVPDGAFHPRTTFREVVRGVASYGNNMGIPIVGGAILFDPGYTANPLVYCGTLGLLPADSHPRQPLPGDAVLLLGGRTGRDGLHGATMSSETLQRATVSSSTVQIGAPITEKTVRDVIPRLRDERLYHAITDCGAGGLCSAIGEMGEELGVEVDLALVPLKYVGLTAWEIWLSEAQERMVLAVPAEALPRLFELCRAYSVEATVLGAFRDDGLLKLRHGEQPVAELAMSFMHAGRPVRQLTARWTDPPAGRYRAGEAADPAGSLLRLLAHPTIASKEAVIRRYDHEVQGATVVKPLAGAAGPSDAAVLRPLPDSWSGAALSHGINPLYTALDPHAMAMLAVDEALRNLVAVGGSIDRVALLDNFCWGDVDDPVELGGLVRATQGCRDAALLYGTPFICGKDSLRNTSTDAAGKHSIPGTLLISAVGVIADVRRCVTMELKAPGNRLYLLGHTADELGGSHYALIEGIEGGCVPRVRPDETPQLMRRLTRAMHHGLVRSCHDLSEGGLAVAVAEMALAGALGVELMLDPTSAEAPTSEALLFSESPGRFVVEVAEGDAHRFEELLAALPRTLIGCVTQNGRFAVRQGSSTLLDLTVEQLDRAWRAPLTTVTGERVGALHADARHSGDRPQPDIGTSTVRALVLAAPGVNCDQETAEACRLAGAEVELIHLNQLLSGRRQLDEFDLLVLPGGFSYGDHLGAGAMLATILRHRLLTDLQRFVDEGRPVLGICNGFQILARLGLLSPVALAPNAAGEFECEWVRLHTERSNCLFLQGLEDLELPVAHGQGRVIVPEGSLTEVLRRAPLRYLDNPNGSVAAIAGVCNQAGTVLGLMPHPERFVTTLQHPRWSTGHGEEAWGLRIFQNAVHYARHGT